MKLKYQFMTNEVADKIVAIAIGEDSEKFDGFIKLDAVAGYIFNMLKNDVTEEDIVISMAKDFPDSTEDEIRQVVTGFVGDLKKDGLID